MLGPPRLKRAARMLSRARGEVALWASVTERVLDFRGSAALSDETVAEVSRAPAEGGGEPLLDLVQQVPAALLQQAVSHSSWVASRARSYERLEFLGDSVLGLAIASTLYERYPDKEEGDLARIKAFVVSRTSCVQVAKRLGVSQMIMAHAPVSEQRRKEITASPAVLGNVLEALMGASYLAHGFDRTRAAIIEAFESQIDYAITVHVDYKTTLQELLAPRGLQPVYRLVEEAGPPHARMFTSEAWIRGTMRGRGAGTTIKMSEQAAAREALASLKSESEGS